MTKDSVNVLLTPPQRLWLETLYNKINKGEDVSGRALKLELKGKIPDNFNPAEIPNAFFRGKSITLLGIALIDAESKTIKNTNKVIKGVRKILQNNPDLERIFVEDVSKVMGLDKYTVAIAFEDLAYLGVFQSSGTSYGVKGWASINIDERVFNEYFQYETIQQVIDDFIEKSENHLEPKDNMQVDPKKVFVVHGRNNEARKAMVIFLRSIGLHPISWTEAVKATGKASPYVGDILDAGFSIAQAAVILFTPDDEARLLEEFRYPDDEEFETNLTPQARQNVIYEAGMAMGMFPERTVIIEFGRLRPISDIIGRHVIRMNNSVSRRQELANRLQIAGCNVNLMNSEWHSDGDFESVLESVKKKDKVLVVTSNENTIETDFKLTPTFNFQCNHSPNVFNDQCSLNIKFKNEGNKTIRDFRIDILFPNDFLNQYAMYVLEVQSKRIPSHRLFRVLPTFNGSKPLYPGDEIMPMLSYEVSEEQKVNGSLNQKLFVDIYVEDIHILSTEKEIIEFAHISEIEINKKLDETVPGGRYIVDGKVVNANGEEIE